MNWKGLELETYPKIIDKALTLSGEELKGFVEAYYKEGGPYAKDNIGYFSGYYDRPTAKQICEIFNTKHPIFGDEKLKPQEIFEIGVKMGEKLKEQE